MSILKDKRGTSPDSSMSRSRRTVSILVINPNSTTSMTSALEPLIEDLKHPHLSIDFFTAPASAPPSINDEETSVLSAHETFPVLRRILEPPDDDDDKQQAQNPTHIAHSAYLIACYSPHPLTPMLRAHTTAPVLNIFEASILHARALHRPFGIVTTGAYWEPVLSEGVRRFLTGSGASDRVNEASGGEGLGRFVGVRSTGLNATELHSTAKTDVDSRIARASAELVRSGAEVILLGCAGMSGMEAAVREGAASQGKEVVIVDGVRAGIVILEGLVRAQGL